jgi:hypothetical protein
VTYSPLGRGSFVARLVEAARSGRVDRASAAPWGIDLAEPAGAAKLCLLYALAANPNGPVLCGMHSKASLQANLATAGQLDAIEPGALIACGRELRARIEAPP